MGMHNRREFIKAGAGAFAIAATGSESSNSCVITKEDEQLKRFCDNDLHRPVFAIESEH